MAHSRRRFGPLFRVTAVAALVLIVSMPFWPKAQEQWTAWMLSRRLRDSAEPVRREAAEQLVRLGPPASSWVIGAMRDTNPVVRRLACSILPRTVPEQADQAVRALIAAAQDSDLSVRTAAVEQLGAFVTGGPLRTDAASRELALGAVRRALEDSSPRVREAAGWTLWNLGTLAKSAAGDLDRALDGPHQAPRVVAAMALLKICPNEARPRIAAAMASLLEDHSDPFNHHRAVTTLINAIGEDAMAIRLAPLLKSQNRDTRSGAMLDLTVHCPNAKALTSYLKDAMASPDAGIRCDAALFLVAHRPELASQALDLLVAEIVNPVEGTYYFSHVIDQLKRMSPQSLARVAGRLADALPEITNGERRVYVIMALGQIGPDAKAAVPALSEAANSSDQLAAVRAVESLTKIDPKTAAAKLPALVGLMKPGHAAAVRWVALAALRDLGPAAVTAVPELLKVVDEEDLTVSTAAIEALTKIDPPAAAAIKQGIESGALRSRDD